jgi:hypothetical protein
VRAEPDFEAKCQTFADKPKAVWSKPELRSLDCDDAATHINNFGEGNVKLS